MPPASTPTVAAVVCTYTEHRWPDLVRAVDSLVAQTSGPPTIIVVVDHNPALLDRARRELAEAVVVANSETRGLSGARNSGVRMAQSDIVAFLDDDAVAAPDWLERLVRAYDERAIGVGGRVIPAWDVARPGWFPEEFDWVVGCSYKGLPEERTTVRNMIGANMSLRRTVFDAVGGFATGIGRVGTVPLGCEETELCIRATSHRTGAEIVYEPAAVVSHRVPVERARPRYFLSRCLAEGRSKALVAGLVGSDHALRSERHHLTSALPRGVAAGLRDAAHGRPAGLARAVMIVVGATLAAVGYGRGRVTMALRRAS